jgi:hypothetical protein
MDGQISGAKRPRISFTLRYRLQLAELLAAERSVAYGEAS